MIKKIFGTIGSCLIFIVAIAVSIFFTIFLIHGGAKLADIILPYLSIIFAFTLLIAIIILLPLSIFRRTRNIAGWGLVISSFVFGFTLWVWGFLLTYVLWGAGALIIGLFIAGVGVIPIAMLATLFKGMWSIFAQLILLLILTFGARFLGVYLAERAEELDRELDF